MALSEAPLLCNFEIESSAALTYIPLIVRLHLDRCGLRISLAQWQLLPLEDRKLLTRFPADDVAAREPDFARALSEMLDTHAHTEPVWFTPDARPSWHSRAVLPAGLAQHCAPLQLTLAQWGALTVFQRYVLDKLSRKPQVHPMLLPALREFGLLGDVD